MTLARQIAERIHALSFDDIPPGALDWTAQRIHRHGRLHARRHGGGRPAHPAAVPGVAEAPGPALIFATDRRTSVLDATLVNGTASHALDYDDVAGCWAAIPRPCSSRR